MLNNSDLQTILFSSTLGWNPGDEIILMGIEALLQELGCLYHKKIFDRNPRHLKHSTDWLNSSYDEFDYIVFSGTPGWWQEIPRISDYSNSRNFLRHTLRSCHLRLSDRSNDPLLNCLLSTGKRCSAIGVGSSKLPEPGPKIRRVLQNNTDFFSVRDFQTRNAFLEFAPVLLPCPAFFSSQRNKPKQELDKIGITLQALNSNHILISKQKMTPILESINKLASTFSNIEFICHAEKDISFVKEHFSSYPVHYADCGEDLLAIYDQFDFVASTRLHGCVAAMSLGIPTFQLFHGLRLNTLEQFPVLNKSGGEDLLSVIKTTDICAASRTVLEEKRVAKSRYLNCLRERFLDQFDTAL